MIRNAIIMTALIASIFGIAVTVLFFDGEGSGICVVLFLFSTWGLWDSYKHKDDDDLKNLEL